MKKTLAAFALATIAILGSSAPALAAPTNPLANQASYWESPGVTCTKVEINENIKTFTLSDPQSGTEYVTLILKAGSGELANTVIASPVAGVAYGHSTGKDLSHAITCVGAAVVAPPNY
jgi:hypothetical protein